MSILSGDEFTGVVGCCWSLLSKLLAALSHGVLIGVVGESEYESVMFFRSKSVMVNYYSMKIGLLRDDKNNRIEQNA